MADPNTKNPFHNNNQPNPFNLPSMSSLSNPFGTTSGSFSLLSNPTTSNPKPFGAPSGNPFAASKQENITNQPTNPFSTNSSTLAPVSNTNREQTSTKQIPSMNLQGKNEEKAIQGPNTFINSGLFGVHNTLFQSAPEPAKKDLTSIFGSSGTPPGNLFNATSQNQGLFGQNETSSKSSEKSLHRKQSDKSKQRVGPTNPLKNGSIDTNTRPNPNPSFLSSTGIPTFLITPKDQPLFKQQPQQKQQQQQKYIQKMETLQQKTQKLPWSFPISSISSTQMFQTQKKDHLIQKPNNPTTLEQPTLKKDHRLITNQTQRQNPKQKGNEVKQEKTQQLFAEVRNKNPKMYFELHNDIKNGRQITSKAQMKDLLEEEKKIVKQKLIDKLKENKKPVNFDNHRVVYDDLWSKRISEVQQHIQMLQGYKATLKNQINDLNKHLIIEKQYKQKHKEIMEIKKPDMPPVPQEASICLEEYKKQMQIYKQQPEIIKQEQKIEKLREKKVSKQKKLLALKQKVEEIQNNIKYQQTIYKGVDYQIIDIFHNEHQFKEYYDNVLVTKRNQLMSKYQSLKEEIKSTNKNNKSKF